MKIHDECNRTIDPLLLFACHCTQGSGPTTRFSRHMLAGTVSVFDIDGFLICTTTSGCDGGGLPWNHQCTRVQARLCTVRPSCGTLRHLLSRADTSGPLARSGRPALARRGYVLIICTAPASFSIGIGKGAALVSRNGCVRPARHGLHSAHAQCLVELPATVLIALCIVPPNSTAFKGYARQRHSRAAATQPCSPANTTGAVTYQAHNQVGDFASPVDSRASE
jgi:hypothetical protein